MTAKAHGEVYELCKTAIGLPLIRFRTYTRRVEGSRDEPYCMVINGEPFLWGVSQEVAERFAEDLNKAIAPVVAEFQRYIEGRIESVVLTAKSDLVNAGSEPQRG